MSKGRKPRKTKTLMERVDEKYPGYVNEVIGLSVQQLEKRIADMQKNLEDSENDRDLKHGEILKQLTEQKKLINGPYDDVKKAVAMKTKFLVSLVREKGGA